ncbi:DNA excision repair protein ERCC-8 [Coemansia sp. S610]|nr:DNA excision repair protein ERCC-8 [Coemansia sp. S610]
MNQLVRNRATGATTPSASRRAATEMVLSTMALAETKRMARAHSAAVHSLAIDNVEHRYMLSAGADTSIQLYDLNSFEQTPTCARQVAPTSQIAANAASTHTSLISSIAWYPLDKGMFTTSSFDHTLRVWDAQSMAEACQFDLDSRVLSHCMSVTGEHALIATTNESAYIRLCDLRSGSSAQTLLAHHSGSMAAAWSPKQPFVLASGGIDGALCMWDIRRADSQLCSFGHSADSKAGPSESSNNSSSAIGGSIGSVLFTGDGDRVISMASSGKVSVWNTASPENPLVECQLDASKRGKVPSGARQMALTTATTRRTADYEMLFCPSGDNSIAAIDIAKGKQVISLDSHFAPVLCTTWRPEHLELYSGGADGNVLVWCPPAAEELSEDQKKIRQDTWSDSDNAEEHT